MQRIDLAALGATMNRNLEQKCKKEDSEFVGIAEGGARTRDLEVSVLMIKSHTLYRLSYPGRSDDQVH